jgi:glyoxylase-like metal-dependent hydrolase (beta-lactamase superfamily II)
LISNNLKIKEKGKKVKVLKKPMGEYQTNCYILKFDDFEIIIDSGVNSLSWISENVTNPKAVLLTHGHFDHMWDCYKVARKYDIPIYINRKDLPLLKSDIFQKGIELLDEKLVTFLDENSEIFINKVKIQFHHFAGHSEGSSIIEIENSYFCGDVIFKGSIGRFDFPYSDPKKMKSSLIKVLEFNENFTIYSGHGENTTIKDERENIKMWIKKWTS